MPDLNSGPPQKPEDATAGIDHDSVGAQGSTMSPVQQSVPTKTPSQAPSTVETMSYAQAAPRKRFSEAPDAIGRYRVIKEVGSGSFGKVYRCHDDQLQRDVAVKLRHREDAPSDENTSEFLHELRSVARLRHPNIVAVLDVGQTDDGGVFILYEFVSGKTLKQRFEARNFTQEQALTWLIEVADALHYAHKQGLVHRDVKPGNIMVDDAGQTRLADFGLATIDDQFFTEQAGGVLGTVAYMSPEQAGGQSHWATPQSDIYSLGVILYELVAGRRPFSADSMSELLEQVKHRPPAPPRTISDKVSPELEEICLKAMAKEPAQRYRTAADFASDLRRVVKRRTAVGSPWRYVAGAVAAAGLVAMIVWGRGINNNPGGSNANVAPATADVLPAPELEIHLQQASQKEDFKVLREGDVPLHAGDKVQLHVMLDRPAYVYLYWYDASGAPRRLWPAASDEKELAAQQAVTEVWSPQNAERGSQSEWWPLDNNPGAEMAFAAVTDRPLTAAELQAFEAKRFALADEVSRRDTLVEFERSVKSRRSRSRGLGANPVVSPKKVLRDFEPQLNSLFTYYHGWVFFHE